ncbi:unnamed protein product [Musa banksii]
MSQPKATKLVRQHINHEEKSHIFYSGTKPGPRYELGFHISLKGRGQGVDLGTSTRSLMRWIIFFRLPRELPNDPLNRFPRFVFLSPRPHGTTEPIAADASENAEGNMEENERTAGCSGSNCIAVLASHRIAIGAAFLKNRDGRRLETAFDNPSLSS